MSRITTQSIIRRALPPAPLPGPVDLLLFKEMEHEDDELALLLWRRIREVNGNAPADPEHPDPQAWEPATACVTGPDLQSAFVQAVDCLLSVGSSRPQPLASAFVTLSSWAEDRTYLRTSAACAESAAYLCPSDPEPAIVAGRLRRRLAEYDRAELWYLRGAALARRQRRWEPYIQALLWHGFLHFQKAEYAQAERKYRSAGRAALRYGRRALAGVAHHNLLTLASDRGLYAEGERHAVRALSLYPVHFPRVPHLVHDYAFLLARNGYFSAALKLVERVYPLIAAVQERIVVVGNIARAAGGARRADVFGPAAEEVRRLAAMSDENASRGFLGAAEGAYCLGYHSQAIELATRAIEVAARRGDGEVQRLACIVVERAGLQEPPPADREDPPGFRGMARECDDRLRRWVSPPRGQAANMLRKYHPRQPPPGESAASMTWRAAV